MATARQVRASYDAHTITVYQAYSPDIADAALAAGTFVAPFKTDRMTWIKPSFLWMAYRCGWAAKPGQERVLAIGITRDGFDWALRHSALSHYDSTVHTDRDTWRSQLAASPVRIQWDPERDLRLRPLPQRSIQIGLGAPAVRRYLGEWIQTISDVTETMRSIHHLIRDGKLDAAGAALPREAVYPLAPDLPDHILHTGNGQSAERPPVIR